VARERSQSRFRRKHQLGGPAAGSTWWAPGARGWWIGVLFAVGSTLFALGAVPGYADLVGTRADSLTFFTGSLFFTAAAFLAYREAVDAGQQPPAGRADEDQTAGHGRHRRRFFVVQRRRIDWWATAVQLAGTLFFNASTGNALRTDLSARAAHQHIWRPDALGSVCFLASSALAWAEACDGWAAWRPWSWAWWITLANLAGSAAFGISAVAGYISPTTGRVSDAGLASLGTLAGALCFFAGSLALLPERTEGDLADGHARAHQGTPESSGS